MSLLAYDDPSDTEASTDMGKRDSLTSATSASSLDVSELRTALKAANEAHSKSATQVQVLETELARFKDQHAFAIAAKEAVAQQLRDEIVRRETAEEKVELLRGQVEQARRSVMALQKQDQERARAASSSGAPEGDEAPKKRQSLYGRGRPLSAVSTNDEPPLTPTTGLRELRLGARAPSAALRVSTDGPVKSPSPGASPIIPKSEEEAPQSPDPDALTAAQEELSSLRLQLEALSAQFAESEEARIASESCVKALREFIASGPETEVINLPPLPTDKEDEQPVEAATGKWGFKLWNSAVPPESPRIAVTPPETSPMLSVKSGMTGILSPESPALAKVDEDQVIAPAPVAGIGRSLTSFFGRKRGQSRAKPESPAVSPAAENDTTTGAPLTALPRPISASLTSPVGLGLKLEDSLPPPPSASEIEVEAHEPTQPVKTTEAPKPPARSPARSASLSPAPETAPSLTSPESTRADSPPPGSTEDIATPADSPAFSPKDAEEDDEEEETVAKPARTPQRSGATRRGSKARGRGARRA